MSFLNELFSARVWGEKSPTAPKWNKWIHRNLSDNHCPECLMLDGGWFLKEKTPKWLHHPFCHCVLEDIPYNDVLTKTTSDSAYSKFDPYLFNTEGKYPHNKEKLFKEWGYLEKYISGNYALGKLNKDGQRISIRIEIPRKDKTENVSFITGWMAYPNGHIQLTTPYGGK